MFRCKRYEWVCLLIAVLAAALTAPVGATDLTAALDVQGQGLSLAAAGVGLQTLGAGTATLSVQIGGPVQKALLYWAGRDRPCPQSGGACVVPSQPYKDQVLRFDGNLLTGAIIGTEGQPVSGGGPIDNIGYLADVTAIVQARGPGLQSFNIQDGDLGSNLFRLNGAGLVVVYTDPADPGFYRVMVFQGLDFAFGDDPTPGPTRITVPVVFQHGAAAAARQARVTVFTGDGEAGRPDRVDLSNNPSLVNTLDGSNGLSWDADTVNVQVPAGSGSTTVQVFSEPIGQNPDSLLWELAAMRLPVPAPPVPTGDEGCSPGYWKNHTRSWAAAGYSPSQSTSSVFSAAGAYGSLGSQSLLQSIQGGGGPGATGAAKILLRAAVAALLNAAHPGVDYTRTAAAIVSDVNAALAGGDRDAMLALASALDDDNNLGCPLS
jgi:hypothetical protein